MTRILAAGLLAAVAVAGVQSWRLASEQAAHAETRAQHAHQIAAIAEAARQAEADVPVEWVSPPLASRRSPKGSFERLVLKHGITRIGVAKNFLHFGIGPGLPDAIIWEYQ